MFRITMLPAAQGDCLWIEYGKPTAPKRMIIDGGVHATAAALRERIEDLPVKKRVFELAVITHVDLDHIAGMLELLEDPPTGLVIKDFWFNGFDHLPESADDTSVLGARMGEVLMHRLQTQTDHLRKWNGKFRGTAISVRSMELPTSARKLPSYKFAGGMRMTVLAPLGKRLLKLRKQWLDEIDKLGLTAGRAGASLVGHPEDEEEDDTVLGDDRLETARDIKNLAAGTFHEDTSKANGSSIVLLAECDGKRCLFAGDAFAADVLAAVNLLNNDSETPFAVDAWKLAHHGGDKNTSAELIAAIETDTYLVSTSGVRYGHPKAATLCRVLTERPDVGTPRFVFNFSSKQTKKWSDPSKFGSEFRYQPVYPASEGTQVVEL